MNLTGLHHLTAMASNPARNAAFYTRVLGLRLVKKTVNFDDPGTYHLYYGDEVGSPGTIITFFPWPNGRRGTPGVGQVTALAFAIPKGSLESWHEHVTSANVDVLELAERFGERLIAIADPDGIRIELIESADDTTDVPPLHLDVPTKFALRGFHGATLSLESQDLTGKVLTNFMGATLEQSEANRFRYRLGAARIDLLCLPSGRRGREGTGVVHHIAWATPDDADQAGARNELASAGFNVSPVMDRSYFHSIYYREPGGVLFEIATNPPGFSVDEPIADLGTTLMLPPWLEGHRAVIESQLPSLEMTTNS